MAESIGPECDFCSAMALFQIEAQWTLFDFDYAFACLEHKHEAFRGLLFQKIDGARPHHVITYRIYEQSSLFDGAVFSI